MYDKSKGAQRAQLRTLIRKLVNGTNSSPPIRSTFIVTKVEVGNHTAQPAVFACVGDITCSSRRGSWQQTMDLTTLSSELVQDWGPEACYSLGGAWLRRHSWYIYRRCLKHAILLL